MRSQAASELAKTLVSITLAFFALSSRAIGAERAWPLWDGEESVEHYARRAHLPPTQKLDLGDNIFLELALIPAGRFLMGTPEPEPPAETPLAGQIYLYEGGAAVLALLLYLFIVAAVRRRRPRFSLRFLLLLTFAASLTIYGGIRWRKTVQAWQDYSADRDRQTAAFENEHPAHAVTIVRPFYMGKFPVTSDQDQRSLGAPALRFTAGNNASRNAFPAANISWNDAQEFCKRVSARRNASTA